MSRYFNENPQVSVWKDEAFKNQKLWEEYKDMCEFQKEVIQNLVKKTTRLKMEMKSFNDLPWWKKMFFKFDV